MPVPNPFLPKVSRFIDVVEVAGVPVEVWGYKCSPNAWIEQGVNIHFPTRLIDTVADEIEVYAYAPECNREHFDVMVCPDGNPPIGVSDRVIFRLIESALLCSDERCPWTILGWVSPGPCRWEGSIALKAGTLNIALIFEEYLGVEQWRVEFSGCVSPTIIKTLPMPTTDPASWGDTLVLNQDCCAIPVEAEGYPGTGEDPDDDEDSTGILNWVIYGVNKPYYPSRLIDIVGGVEVWAFAECCDDTECPVLPCCELSPPENNGPVIEYTISNKTGTCTCLPDGGTLVWHKDPFNEWGGTANYVDDNFHCPLLDCEEDATPVLTCCNYGYTGDEAWKNYRWMVANANCGSPPQSGEAVMGSCDPFLLVFDHTPSTANGSYRVTITKKAA